MKHYKKYGKISGKNYLDIFVSNYGLYHPCSIPPVSILPQGGPPPPPASFPGSSKHGFLCQRGGREEDPPLIKANTGLKLVLQHLCQ